MPWCPRCDEEFPEGPACPRCRSRLVERDEGPSVDSLPDFPSLKVSRRYRRAFHRLSVRKPPSMRVLAIATTTLVFAVGFLMGRVASVNPGTGPTVGTLPATRPLAYDDVNGSALYVMWLEDGTTTIAGHDLYSGQLRARARFVAPFEPSDGVKTRLVSLEGSVALVASEGDTSFIAFDPRRGAKHAWIPGTSAAWETPERLLVLQRDGSVVRWTIGAERVRAQKIGRAERLLQTATGAVLQREGKVAGLDDVLAISPDGKRAIAGKAGPRLFDGRRSVPIDLDRAYRALSASFEPGDSGRAAVVMSRGSELMLAIVDEYGNAALRPLGTTSQGCAPMPVWDSIGRWVYVNAGNEVLHAFEAGGGRDEIVHTRSLGCGLAWTLTR